MADPAFLIQNLTSRVATLEVVSPIVVTTWTQPALLNSWVDFGGTFDNVEYRRVGDEVQLRGMAKDGTASGGTDCFVLPAGFRPPNTVMFNVISNGALARVDVLADGSVEVSVGLPTVSNTYVNFSGIRFSVTA